MEETVKLLKLLADETRMKIVNILAKEDCYVELIASKLEMTPATVCYHLKKMEQAGLVSASRSQFYIIYSLKADVFDRTLRELVIKSEPIEDPEDTYKKEVLSHFFKFGKLQKIPVQQKKREIVLEKMLERFEAKRSYTEKEVSEILMQYHSDYCTLRREMVAFGFMTRDHEIYKVVKK